MKKIIICALLFALISITTTQASTITFYGVVDEPNQTRFHTGDILIAQFRFNTTTGLVSFFDIRMGNRHFVQHINREQMMRVAYYNDPSTGRTLYWQVTDGVKYGIEIMMQAASGETGEIPPIEQFQLNEFILFGTLGHMIAVPAISVPFDIK